MTDHAAADFAWIGQLTAPELEHVRALQVSPWRAAVVSARTIKRLAAARAEDAARMERLLCKIVGMAVDGQNELHGIKHGGPAKRTLRDIERLAVNALAAAAAAESEGE